MDQHDEYLSKTLKNWAANQQPPRDGRSRLLQAARGFQAQRETGGGLWEDIRNRCAIDVVLSRRRDSRSFAPVTQSRLWSLYMVTSSRFAF